MILLIKLILAHLIGDFLLQPNSWVKEKEIKRLMAWQLYVHIVVHFVLILLLVWDISFLKWALILSVSHFLTDILKLYFQKVKTKRLWFFADQVIHFVFIFMIWSLSQRSCCHLPAMNTEYCLILITFVYFLTQPASVIVKSVVSRWTPADTIDNSGSLQNAGNLIGIMERMFVFAFVVTGQMEAIGFLIAAKSVFRFGDLKEARDRKLTEYVLIGTLLSVGIALFTGLLFLQLTRILD